ILADPETAAACGDRARHYLIEEFIPGYEVALEGLVVDRRLHVLALFDKPDPLDGPFFEETIYVTPSTVPGGLQAAIKDCADRAVRAIGITDGPIHAELRYNENGPWLIEEVQITAHPGERLIPFPEGSRYPGFIFARGETPAAVETALREAHSRLTFVIA